MFDALSSHLELYTLTWSQPVAAWLLTYVLHSTLLVGAAWVLARFFAGALAQDLLWKTVVVAGIVTASVQVGMQPSVSIASAGYQAPTTVPRAEASGQPSELHRERGVEQGEAASLREPSVASSGNTSAHPFRGWRLPATASPWFAVLVGLWLLGSVVEGLRRIRAHRRFKGRISGRAPVKSPALVAELSELARLAGMRRSLRLTQTSVLAVPAALGSAEVVLPTWAVEETPARQQRAMLAHEVAHLARRDARWLVVFAVVESVFFFQPLNRLARCRQQAAAERLCDAWAAEQSSPLTMARCLVNAAEQLRTDRARRTLAALPHVVPAMVTGSTLSERVERLVGARKESQRRWPALLVVSLVVSLVVVAAPSVTSTAQPVPAGSSVPNGSAPTSPDSTAQAQLERQMEALQATSAAYQAEMRAYAERLARATGVLEAEFEQQEALFVATASAETSTDEARVVAVRQELAEAEADLRALNRDLRTLPYATGQHMAEASAQVRMQVERLVGRLHRIAPEVRIPALESEALALPASARDMGIALEEDAQRLLAIARLLLPVDSALLGVGERFPSNADGAYRLGFAVVEGSVRVRVDGTSLVEGEDYTVDHATGGIVVINPAYLTSGQTVTVDYERRDVD